MWKWALNEEKTRGAGAITEVCQPEMGPKGLGAGKKGYLDTDRYREQSEVDHEGQSTLPKAKIVLECFTFDSRTFHFS